MGFIILCISSGGINGCMPIFGADQLPLPQKKQQIFDYFSYAYLFYKFGVFISYVVANKLLCSEANIADNECHFVMFLLCAAVDILRTTIFLGAHSWYIIGPITRNILFRAIKCIAVSIAFRNTFEMTTWPSLSWARHLLKCKVILFLV